MKSIPGTRLVACRKCGGKGGWMKVLCFGLTIFVACRQCKGNGRAREHVGR